MKDEIRKTEVLINGDFTETELKELEKILADKNIEVAKYFTKAFETEEIVRVLFRDLNAYEFLRDGILFELLMFGFTKSISWAKGKKPKAKVSGGIELRLKTTKKEVPVNISVPSDNAEFWTELEKTLTIDFADSLKEGEITNIFWDAKEDKIKITKL